MSVAGLSPTERIYVLFSYEFVRTITQKFMDGFVQNIYGSSTSDATITLLLRLKQV